MNSDDWQARTRLLIGDEKTVRLARSHVLVVGLGGVGGIAAEMIARAGVGEMTIADGDTFDATNRNRQIGALASTVGQSKTAVFAARLRDISPDIKLHAVDAFLHDESMTALLGAARYDCVLDAIDSLSPKAYLALYCVRHGLPLVSCMGSGARLNPELVRCADIAETEHCSLARALRKRLRKLGVNTGFQAVFSPEEPPPGSVVEINEDTDGATPYKRSVTGTISYMPAVFGCHCAAAVLRTIADAAAD